MWYSHEEETPLRCHGRRRTNSKSLSSFGRSTDFSYIFLDQQKQLAKRVLVNSVIASDIEIILIDSKECKANDVDLVMLC